MMRPRLPRENENGFGMSDAHGTTTVEHSGLKQPYHLVDPEPLADHRRRRRTAHRARHHLRRALRQLHRAGHRRRSSCSARCSSGGATWCAKAARPALHTPVVRLGLRYGMMFFISSEVMFFVGFFWAFFNFALFPELQGNGQTVWPPSNIHTFDPFHLPFLNTMILLLSGTTVTWAHHGLLERPQEDLVIGLGLTILLGLSFTAVPGDRVFRRAVQVRRRRHLSVHLLPRHRLPRLPRHRRHLLPDRLLVPRAAPTSSRRSGISASRPPPGTGISSTWSGCSCSPASTGGAPARSSRRTDARAGAQPAPSLLHVALACRCPRCGKGRLFRKPAGGARPLRGLRPRPARA